VYALKVKKTLAQKKLLELKEKEVFNYDYRIKRQGEFVYLPVSKKIRGAIETELIKTKRKKSLKETFGIGSFDLIGTSIVVSIPPKLKKQKKQIGALALELYPKVTAVYMKASSVSGKYRVPKLELIAGKGGVANHIENGIRLKLDPRKAYFSPRQSSERKKLTKFVGKGDRVMVFFAGIGPIPIYFSKFTKASFIVALEINPDAIKYMKENLAFNKCENVVALCGDVKKLHARFHSFDLVILPLPKSSLDFVDEARSVLSKSGRAIFYVASTKNELKEKLKKLTGFKVEKIRREIEISPNEYRFVVHARKI